MNSCEHSDVSACACMPMPSFSDLTREPRFGQADDARTDCTGQMLAVLEDAALEVARAEANNALAMDLRLYTSCAGWRACGCVAAGGRSGTGSKRRHRDWVMNAVTCDATGDIRSASLESRIRWIEGKACGYRHRAPFCTGICFRLGGLCLYPESLKLAHTSS